LALTSHSISNVEAILELKLEGLSCADIFHTLQAKAVA
jgi:hypothetical protein